MVTTQSSAASSMARCLASFSLNASASRRRSTAWPIWSPRLSMVARSSASTSRGSAVKNSIAPSRPLALRMGKQKAACRPARRAASARGKLSSAVTSGIQAGSPVCHTRPGRPSPGAKAVRRHTASKSEASIPSACHVSAQRSASGRSGAGSHTAPRRQPRLSPIAASTRA